MALPANPSRARAAWFLGVHPARPTPASAVSGPVRELLVSDMGVSFGKKAVGIRRYTEHFLAAGVIKEGGAHRPYFAWCDVASSLRRPLCTPSEKTPLIRPSGA